MCTIEMIENLKIENSTKMWMCAISPYERRYVLPIQGIKMFRPLMIISKICRKHDHVKRAN